MKTFKLPLIALAAALWASHADRLPAADPRPVPDIKLMVNVDGGASWPDTDPRKAREKLTAEVSHFATRWPVAALSYGIGYGMLHYPSKIESVREHAVQQWIAAKKSAGNPSTRSEAEARERHMKGLRHGLDPLRWVGETFHTQHNKLFFLSRRMNDDHFAHDPEGYPFTLSFWKRELAINDFSHPNPTWKMYRNLLDYSHKEVREYQLSVIGESIERYKDVIDGYELDFVRAAVYFPSGAAVERSPLMTDLVARVRRQLDELEKTQGRPYYLVVRVPPSLDDCMGAGLDVPDWMSRRLVDVVVPAHIMVTAHDLPIGEFKAIASTAGVKVLGGLVGRKNRSWDFAADAGSQQKIYAKLAPSLFAKKEFTMGAAINLLHQGADGLQTSNYSSSAYIGIDWFNRMMAALGNLDLLLKSDNTYAVPTRGGPLRPFEYEKSLPAILPAATRRDFSMLIGGDVTGKRILNLRIGLGQAVYEKLELVVEMNKARLSSGDVATALLRTSAGSRDANKSLEGSAAGSYFHVAVPKALVVHGPNTISIEANQPLEIIEIEFGAMN